MRVYVVTAEDWDAHEMFAVYSTREKAEHHKAEWRTHTDEDTATWYDDDDIRVSEFEIDYPKGATG